MFRIHEKLLIARLRTGKSQSEFALQLGIDYNLYRRVENGTGHVHQKILEPFAQIVPDPRERAILTRKRHKMTQSDLALAMGYCRYWIVQMERGHVNSDPIINFWESVNDLSNDSSYCSMSVGCGGCGRSDNS